MAGYPTPGWSSIRPELAIDWLQRNEATAELNQKSSWVGNRTSSIRAFESSSMNLIDMITGGKSEQADRPDTQDLAPIPEALQTYLRASPISFEMPGHQAGKGAPHAIT